MTSLDSKIKRAVDLSVDPKRSADERRKSFHEVQKLHEQRSQKAIHDMEKKKGLR